MKKLFIYYSFTGNGDVVAEYLKNKVDIRKVETKEKLPKTFFFQMMVGGFKGGIGYKDKLYDYDKDISKYDEIIIGSPIWNGSICAPINRVLDDLDLKDKKLSFIFWSGSGTSPSATKKVNELFGDVKVIDLQEPIKNKNELKKVII
ncbi:MAG: NAD(P)H-dependent oxidoreductase [Bacilli bacterium]|nr:NAD(P)H-dependent oxidoreductase [Bacilli bacterium]